MVFVRSKKKYVILIFTFHLYFLIYASVLNVFLPWMFRIYSSATYFEQICTIVPNIIRPLQNNATHLIKPDFRCTKTVKYHPIIPLKRGHLSY